MEGRLVVRGRVEIDSRQPFKSVKEAVMLFGEKVLVGEIYAHKLKEMGSNGMEGNEHGAKVEFCDKKQTLESSKDEGKLMTYHLMSLKQQLEETESKLNQLKSTREPHPIHYTSIDSEIENIKFNQNPILTYVKPVDNTFNSKQDDPVKFIEVPKMQDRSHSSSKIKKTKKKTIIPLLGGISSKK